jgi:ubiquinone/menaquinone biosynthesis C-methylase UbiE
MVRRVPAALKAEEIREANERYHDAAAHHYDFKWGIDFGAVGERQVIAKLCKALGHAPGRYERSLEIGAGTGYFTLNMLRAGLIGNATCADISPGMLSALRDNARRLGLDVHTARADAEQLPFADASFDLVFGHAVLHHIPDLERAFAEFGRVLAPGGTLLFAGEPSRYGDRLSALPKRVATATAPLWRRALGVRAAAPARAPGSDAALERLVDVHAFAPAELRRAARGVGLREVRVSGEELLANWFGWANRTLEASADPEQVPWLWRQYAYRGYLLLQALDSGVLEARLPAGVFYNLMLSARRPHPARAGAQRHSAARASIAAGGRSAARSAARTGRAGGIPAAGRSSRR